MFTFLFFVVFSDISSESVQDVSYIKEEANSFYDFKYISNDNALVIFAHSGQVPYLRQHQWVFDLEHKDFKVKWVLIGNQDDLLSTKGMIVRPDLLLPPEEFPAKPSLHYWYGKNKQLIPGLPTRSYFFKNFFRNISSLTSFGQTLNTKNIIPQTSDYDCGAASLTMLLARNSIEIDHSEVLDYFSANIEKRTISLLELKKFLLSYGIQSRGAKCNISRLRQIDSPVIIHLRERHYTVFLGFFGNKAIMLDPRLGVQLLEEKQFLERWSGIYFEIQV